MSVPLNLLREPIAALRGTRNPGSQGDRLTVHSGSCVPYALLSDRSQQFYGALI